MIQLKSEKFKKRFWLAETSHEVDILKEAFDEGFVFGMWQFWDGRTGKGKNVDIISATLSKYPNVIGMAFINDSAGFVSEKDKIRIGG